MVTRTLHYTCLLTAIVVLTDVCHAVTVTNVTTDTILFRDTFETGSVGALPSTPSFGLGGWDTSDTDVNSSIVFVTDAASPGAVQGDKYLSLSRDGGFAPVFPLFATQSNPGDLIRCETMVQGGATSDSGLTISMDFVDENEAIINQTILHVSGNVYSRANGGSNTVVPALNGSHDPEAWNRFVLEYEVGASTYSVTLNDTTVSGLAIYAPSGGNVAGMRFGNNTGAISYLDAIPIPLQLEVNRLTGRMQIANRSDSDISTFFYRISGEVDSLDPVNWNSLDEQNYDAIGSEVGESWDEAGGSDTNVLAEAYLLSNSTLSIGETVSLGAGYNATEDKQGLVFEYREAVTDLLYEGAVIYIVPGDMNGDGDVDDADVNPFVQALTDRAAFEMDHPDVDADFVGDFNGNGGLDLGDVSAFKAAVLAAGSGAATASAIPEPSTGALLLFSLAAFWRLRNKRFNKTRF